MKKLLSLFLSLSLALGLCFSLTACSDSPESSISGGGGKCQHQFVEFVLSDPTCDCHGTLAKQCSICSHMETFPIDPIAHEYVIMNEQVPTCWSGGFYEYACANCGKIEYESQDPLGHDYRISIGNVPTETSTGYIEVSCSRCSYTSTPTLPTTNSDEYTSSVIDEYSSEYSYVWEGVTVSFTISDFLFHKNDTDNSPYKFDTYRLYDYVGSKTNITLPSTYNGCPVTTISYYAFANSNIVSVTIPEPTFTFSSDDIKDGYLEEGETFEGEKLGYLAIRDSAFENCASLTSVTLPSTISSISQDCFKNCSSLTTINLGHVSTIYENAFENCALLENVDLRNVHYIEDYAFTNCSSIEEVNLENILTINSRAFYNCTALASVTFGDNLQEISAYAFENCALISEIELPSSLESTGSAIFKGCTGIREVIMPNLYWNRFASLFSGHVYYDYYTDIDTDDVPQIDSVIITEQTEIPSYAFSNCNRIASITLCDDTTSIGNYAFENCVSLDGLCLPETVETIGRNAFKGVDPYKHNQDFENKTYYIGTKTNPYLYLLTSDYVTSSEYSRVEIQDGCKYINYDAFIDRDNMTDLIIPASVKYADRICTRNGISNDAVLNVYYKGTATEFSEISFACSGWYIRLFVGDDDNWTEVTDLAISNKLTEIHSYAYAYFKTLETVRIPEGVESIKQSAFNGFIVNLYLPKSITSIENGAFYSGNFENVYYNGTIEDWCKIDFEYTSNNYGAQPMGSAKHFFIKDNNDEWAEVTELYLPDTITKIEQFTFLGFDNLTTLVIPSTVEMVYTTSFALCNNLTIYYEGTEAQWNEIVQEAWLYGNPYSINVKLSFYSEQAPSGSDVLNNPTISYWHYDNNGKVAVWFADTVNNVNGNTYAYTSSDANVSDEYWYMVVQLKDMGMLDDMFSDDPANLEMLKNSNTKAEYEQALEAFYASWGNGLTVRFTDVEAFLSQNGNGSILQYVQLGDKIYYTIGNILAFTVVEDGDRLVETIESEYFTITHYYDIVK